VLGKIEAGRSGSKIEFSVVPKWGRCGARAPNGADGDF
jgi:hypothetical protein